MRKAIDNYAQGKQREVEAWIGSSISASSGRFVCPECLESVALDIRGHFHQYHTWEILLVFMRYVGDFILCFV